MFHYWFYVSPLKEKQNGSISTWLPVLSRMGYQHRSWCRSADSVSVRCRQRVKECGEAFSSMWTVSRLLHILFILTLLICNLMTTLSAMLFFTMINALLSLSFINGFRMEAKDLNAFLINYIIKTGSQCTLQTL